MSERTNRPVELDQDTARWLDRLDEPDELVNQLLHEYRDQQSG